MYSSFAVDRNITWFLFAPTPNRRAARLVSFRSLSSTFISHYWDYSLKKISTFFSSLVIFSNEQILHASSTYIFLLPFNIAFTVFFDIPIAFAKDTCVYPASTVAALNFLTFMLSPPSRFWDDLIIAPSLYVVNPILGKYMLFLVLSVAILGKPCYYTCKWRYYYVRDFNHKPTKICN